MEGTFDFSNISPAVSAFANYISSMATEGTQFQSRLHQKLIVLSCCGTRGAGTDFGSLTDAGFPPGWGQRVLDQYLRAYSHYPPGTFINTLEYEGRIAGKEQHQKYLTGHVGQYETFRRSQVEGGVEVVNRHSGYEQMSSTADNNVGYGEPVHCSQEQENTITDTETGEPSQQRVQRAALPVQEPGRHRQSIHGHRVSSIHFNELKNVWRPGDRLHIPVIAQLQNNQR